MQKELKIKVQELGGSGWDLLSEVLAFCGSSGLRVEVNGLSSWVSLRTAQTVIRTQRATPNDFFAVFTHIY